MTVKIQYMSDLHLEFNESGVKSIPCTGEVLLLVGDIVQNVEENDHLVKRICEWAANYELVIWVPGNHEYNMTKGFDDCHNKFRKAIDRHGGDNILFSDCGHTKYKDVVIIWAVLWADLNHGDWFAAQAVKEFWDFESCDELNPDSMMKANMVHKFYINEMLRKYNGEKIVVATHFPPSSSFSNPRGTHTDHYFYCNFDEAIPDADVWIFGHVHKNYHRDFGDFLVTSNQLGYNQDGIVDFDDAKFIEL